MSKNQTPGAPDLDCVYETYVKPLEQAHKDQYVLVTPTGQTVLAPTLLDAVRQASRVPDKNNVIFKVGEKAVGTIG
jgi:hypothetical protein